MKNKFYKILKSVLLWQIMGALMGGLIVGGMVAMAASQTTVPVANGPGQLLQSTSTGAYVATSLNAGTGITLATTTNSITISTSGGSLTGTTGQVGYFSASNTLIGTSTIFITPSGNVGIGSSTPASILSVGTINGINFSQATSTFNSTGGIDLEGGGCYSITGVCINATITNNISAKDSSNYATAAGLPAYTYTSGVITEVGTGTLSVDGSNPSVGQRILVKNESGACMAGSGLCNNGIYTVTATGSGIAAFVLTRSSDFNSNTNVYQGVSTYIISGSTNSDDTFVLTTANPITVGTTGLTFAEAANGAANVASVTGTANQITASPTTGAVVLSIPTQLNITNASTTAVTAATELNIPHSGTVPGLSAGDIYQNTNSTASSSIQTSESPLFNVHSVSTVLASSTLVYMGSFGASGTTTLPVVNSLHTTTIQSFGCTTDVGTAWVAFGTGLATTTAVQCSSTGKFITISSNNVFKGRQLIKMDVGTSASSPNTITITADVEDSN